jgi:hypothetical protein
MHRQFGFPLLLVGLLHCSGNQPLGTDPGASGTGAVAPPPADLIGIWESTGSAGPGDPAEVSTTIFIFKSDGTFDEIITSSCQGASCATATAKSRIDEVTGPFGVSTTGASPSLEIATDNTCDVVPNLYRDYHDATKDPSPPVLGTIGTYALSSDGNTLTIQYPGGHAGGPSGPDFGPSSQAFTRKSTPSVAPGTCASTPAPIQYDSADESAASNNGKQFCVSLKNGTTQCAPIP